MTPEKWQRITAAFHGALARSPEARAVFLDEACAGDGSMRAEVDALVAAHHRAAAASFSDAAAVAIVSSDAEGDAPPPSDYDSDADAGLRTRRHPFLWIVWVTAAIAAAGFVAGGATIYRTGRSTLGWTAERIDGVWRVGTVDPAGPAAGRLQRRDRLVAFNGRPLPWGPGPQFFSRSLAAGDRYVLAIERRGVATEEQLTVGASGAALAWRLMFLAISFVWCAIGIFVGAVRPDRSTARLAFAGAVATGLGVLSISVLVTGPVWTPLHVVLGYLFFRRFPTGEPARGWWTAGGVLLAVLAAPAAAVNLWLSATLVARGPAAATELVLDHQTAFWIHGLFLWTTYSCGFFGVAAVAARNYTRLTDDDARRRVRWVAFSSVLALAPECWSAVVASIVFVAGPVSLPTVGTAVNVFDLAIPLSVAYAVVKHRVFDVTVAIRRGLQYLLARRALQFLTLAPIGMLLVTGAVQRHRTIAELMAQSTGYLYWTAAAALTLRVRQPVSAWLDRRFFRQAYDREQLLVALLDDLARAESIGDVSRLVRASLDSALHPAALFLWHRDGAAARDFPASDATIAWLEARRQPADVPLPADAAVPRADERRLSALGVNLLVPITDAADRLTGVLGLGAKKSDEPYSAVDRRLLQAVARQAAIVGETLRLRSQVDEEQRIRHDVLARLDERHAGVLKECPACGACYDGAAERCILDGSTLTLSIPVPRLVNDRYRLDRLLGKGGMGAVYEARDLRLNRTVAVKMMLARGFGRTSSFRRFNREARAAARLNHRNIVSVYDFGSVEGGGAYLVMERVTGWTLRSELDRCRTLSPRAAADWFDQLLDGLEAAHAAGVVHRDLKPENVMGTGGRGSSLLVKILDFGLAKIPADERVTGDTLTGEGAVMGTTGYMAKEQLLGHEVDRRADIFAAGVMIAEALTGELPFGEPDRTNIGRAVLEERWHLSPPAGAGELREILGCCLAGDPSRRFGSASALREAIVPAFRRM